MRLGERAVDLADRALRLAPRSARTRATARELDHASAKLQFLRRYTELYKPYTQAQQIFEDHNMQALAATLSDEDAADFPTDCESYSWDDYLPAHCDSITAGLRAMSGAPTRSKPARAGFEQRSDVVAVFDLDGTLMQSNIIESYLWLRLASGSSADRAREVSAVGRQLPRYWTEERRDRAALIRAVYERYAGSSPEELARIVDDEVSATILARVHPAASPAGSRAPGGGAPHRAAHRRGRSADPAAAAAVRRGDHSAAGGRGRRTAQRTVGRTAAGR